MEIPVEGVLVTGAGLPAIGALITYFVQDWRKRDLARYVKTYPERVEFAKGALKLINKTLMDISMKMDDKKIERHLRDKLMKLKEKAILFASPKTLKLWIGMTDEVKLLERDKWQKIEHLGRLFLSLREDVGLSNRGLTRRELLKMILKSYEWLELERNLGRWRFFWRCYRRWRIFWKQPSRMAEATAESEEQIAGPAS